MLSVYVDAGLLAIPSYAVDSRTASALIDRVLHFAGLAVYPTGANVVVAKNLEDALLACYPSYDAVSDFLSLMELDEVFSPNDLVRQYQSLVQRALRVPEADVIEVARFDELSTTPPLPGPLFPADLNPETERAVASTAASVHRGCVVALGSAFPPGSSSHYDVQVRVHAAEVPAALGAFELPVEVIAQIRCIEHISDLATVEDATRIWQGAEDPRSIGLAIALRAVDMRRRAGHPGASDELMSFRVGSNFYSSLERNQASGAGRFAGATLELCAQIVSSTCSRHIGIMGRPQAEVRSDGALGRRVHLSEGGLALRLMFWTSNQVIEFSNIGPKHELFIDSGSIGGATSFEARLLDR